MQCWLWKTVQARVCVCGFSFASMSTVCVYGCEPEAIGEMGFHIADSMAGLPGLKPQKLFNFQNFCRGKKYNFPSQKLFSISHHLNGQIMHQISVTFFFVQTLTKWYTMKKRVVITLNYFFDSFTFILCYVSLLSHMHINSTLQRSQSHKLLSEGAISLTFRL